MGRTLGGLALAALGLFFIRQWEHGFFHGFGYFNVAFGLVYAFSGLRQRTLASKSRDEFQALESHLAEASERMQRGETPEQIAKALEEQYQIAPVRTLIVFARDRLRLIGRGQDAALTQSVLSWLSADRLEQLPDPKTLIAGFDARRNVLGATSQVHSAGHGGLLLASRTHLFYFAIAPEESVGKETFKEILANAIPAGHLMKLGSEVATGVRGELTGLGHPALQRKLTESFEHTGSFAIPWRDVRSIGKEAGVGLGKLESLLVLHHGEPPVECRFGIGSGLNESLVDDWIDLIRAACSLEGRLLLF